LYESQSLVCSAVARACRTVSRNSSFAQAPSHIVVINNFKGCIQQERSSQVGQQCSIVTFATLELTNRITVGRGSVWVCDNRAVNARMRLLSDP
jgi:hypothetical protein